ncbi:MAG: hypothetical protein CMN31_11290 [Sandaracinus sp.]|nr:hypothetical protein [Sandaracinus sp.]
MSGLARVVAERFSASPQAPAFLGALGPVDLAVGPGITAFVGAPRSGARLFARSVGRSAELEGAVEMEGALLLGSRSLLVPPAENVRCFVPTLLHADPLPGSIFDNVVLGLRARGVRRRARLVAAAEAALHAVGLDALLAEPGRPAAALAPVERVRLALARALALRPLAVVVDLPAEDRARLLPTLEARSITHLPLLIVGETDERAEVERLLRVADEVAFFQEGSLVEHGPSPEVLTRPRTAAFERFLAGPERAGAAS